MKIIRIIILSILLCITPMVYSGVVAKQVIEKVEGEIPFKIYETGDIVLFDNTNIDTILDSLDLKRFIHYLQKSTQYKPIENFKFYRNIGIIKTVNNTYISIDTNGYNTILYILTLRPVGGQGINEYRKVIIIKDLSLFIENLSKVEEIYLTHISLF